MKIIALPEAQEISDFGADTGSDLRVLQKEMEGKPVDLSLVVEGWNSKRGKWGRAVEAVDARADEVRLYLKARPEKEVVLVSHLGFVHHLTEDWEGEVGESHYGPYPVKFNMMDLTRSAGTSWLNTEFRTYEFVEEEGGKLSMLETDASRQLRGAVGPRLSKAEQMQRRGRKLLIWERIEADLRAAQPKPPQLPGPAGTAGDLWGGSRPAI